MALGLSRDPARLPAEPFDAAFAARAVAIIITLGGRLFGELTITLYARFAFVTLTGGSAASLAGAFDAIRSQGAFVVG